MEIGKEQEVTTVEPVVEPVPRPQHPEPTPQEDPPVPDRPEPKRVPVKQ